MAFLPWFIRSLVLVCQLELSTFVSVSMALLRAGACLALGRMNPGNQATENMLPAGLAVCREAYFRQLLPACVATERLLADAS